MSQLPEFLSREVELDQVAGDHQPIQSNRRGELLAWLSTLGAAIGSLLLAWRTGQMPGLAVTAVILFGAIAMLISFGNWVERNTKLQLTKERIRYRSPLRKESLSWDDVHELRVSKSKQGWRIQVVGESGSFHYQSQGRLQFADIDSMELGVASGLLIAAFIRKQSKLTEKTREGNEWVCKATK